MNHGWQSEPTDGPKGGWSCSFWSGCSGHLTRNCWMYLSIHLSICLSKSVYLSVYLQAWNRSNSARLPQFSKLTTSKTKKFCETNPLHLPRNTQSVCLSVFPSICLAIFLSIYLSIHLSIHLSIYPSIHLSI